MDRRDTYILVLGACAFAGFALMVCGILSHTPSCTLSGSAGLLISGYLLGRVD